MPLNRTLEQWEKMVPQAVCDGSPAQVLFCITDAQHDVLALAAMLREMLDTFHPKSRADGVKWGATALCTRAEELLK
jgi:hypothetical protein